MLHCAFLEHGILSCIKIILYESEYAVSLAVLIEHIFPVSQQTEIWHNVNQLILRYLLFVCSLNAAEYYP